MPSQKVARLKDHVIDLRSLDPNLDAATVLLTEMARCQVAVEYLDEIVASFSGEDVAALPELVEASGEGAFAMAYHIPMEIWKLWVENRKMLATVSATVVKLGLEERRLAQQDERARQAYLFVNSLLADPSVGLNSQQRRAVGVLIAEKLRAEMAIEASLKGETLPPVLQRPQPDEVQQGLRLVTSDEDTPHDDL